MAVTMATNPNEDITGAPHHYFGLASDTKPTIASPGSLPPPNAGSTFLEHDTGNDFITYDGTNWVAVELGRRTTGLGHGVKTVSTVGTDEVLAASTACKWVIIQAQTDNTDKVAVGASGVDATVATGNGIALDPGDPVTIMTDNLADVYVDALVSGEGVRYVYGT